MAKGVITNIQDEHSLNKYLVYVRREIGKQEVLIEECVTGKDYRVFVVGERAVAAVRRIPANVTGDGSSSIRQLIKAKNAGRKNNPHLSKRLIKLDREVLDYVDKAGYTLESIPKVGGQIFLRGKSNASAGGDTIDATDELSDAIREMAVAAVRAIPGLYQGGVDIMTDNPAGNSCVAIEVNYRAQLGSHLFPAVGTARDIPSAIIDTYFPESKLKDNRSMWLNNTAFNLKSVTQPLVGGSVEEVTVAPAPAEEFTSVKLVVSGHVQGVGYRKWIAKKAQSLKLYGYCKNLRNGSVEVVAASHCPVRLRKLAELCERGPSKAQVVRVEKFGWDGPVNIGFEVKPDSKSLKDAQKTKIAREAQMLNKTIKQLKKKLKKQKRKLKKVTQGAIWLFTSPLRKIARTIRNMF